MAAVKHFKVAALPGILEPDSIYHVKGASDTAYKLYVTTSSSTAIPIDAVTASALAAALTTKENSIAPGTTSDYWRGDKTWQPLNKAAVGLGNVDNTSDANKPISTLQQATLDLKANDNAVVKLTGNQTIAGTKTFSSSPVVPTPTNATDAVNKTYVDTADSNLQNQINTLNTAVTSALTYKGGIDCSANPNYPAASVGHVYVVSVAGRIGGASGPVVESGDMIICKVNSAAGDHATVGANWNIIQNNLGAATETTAGYTRYSTNAEALAGTNDASALTPLKNEAKLNSAAVRFDIAQSLTTPQKTQALNNIGAAGISNVMLLTTDQTAAGTKTFTSAPKLSVGNATTSSNYLLLEPTDYGAGKPRIAIAKSSSASVWHFILTDGSTNNGQIDFISQNLTWNNQSLATQTWANSQFSLLGHTHTFASLTSKPTTIAGFGITDAYTKTEVNTLTSWYATEW